MNYANILELLLRMRQFCDHPLLLPQYDSATNSFTNSNSINGQMTVTGGAKACETVSARKERIQRLMCVDLTAPNSDEVLMLPSLNDMPSLTPFASSSVVPHYSGSSSFTAINVNERSQLLSLPTPCPASSSASSASLLPPTPTQHPAAKSEEVAHSKRAGRQIPRYLSLPLGRFLNVRCAAIFQQMCSAYFRAIIDSVATASLVHSQERIVREARCSEDYSNITFLLQLFNVLYA